MRAAARCGGVNRHSHQHGWRNTGPTAWWNSSFNVSYRSDSSPTPHSPLFVMAVIVFFVRLADVARSLSESVVERVSLVERCDLDPCGLASDLFRDLRE